MTILSFQADFNDDKAIASDLPVEVRKLNLAFVRRTLASQPIEVEPGTYYATAKLPDGRHLFGQSEITGEFAKIMLSTEPEDETTPFPTESSWFGSMRSRRSRSFNQISSFVSLHHDPVDPGVRPDFQLQQFVGNVLSGDFSLVQQHEPYKVSEAWFGQFSITGSGGNTLIQLLQPGEPPLNVMVPVYFDEACNVSVLSSGDYMDLTVHLTHPEADLLLQYLEKGYLQQAATLVNAKALDSRDLLENDNVSAAAIKFYTKLRLGDLDELVDIFGRSGAFANRLRWFPDIPDSVVIRGEVLARLGRHNEALEAFCELPRLGLPLFGDGLSYAFSRLKLYDRCGADSFTTKSFRLVTPTLASLHKFAAHRVTLHPLLIYTGLNLAEPDNAPLKSLKETQIIITPPPRGSFMAVDLGDTKSVVAVMREGHPEVVQNRFGTRALPSIVAWRDNGEQLIGVVAKRQAVVNVRNTIPSIRRFLGKRFDDISDRVDKIPFEIFPGPNRDIRIRVADKVWSPEEILAIILRELKKSAEEYSGEVITSAVITVPASFDTMQRAATKNAGTIAGLKEIYLLNEPTAAALAYGIGRTKPETIAVFDFGGGTFDVSIVEVSNAEVHVRASCGDPDLGGNDIDEYIADWLKEEFKRATGIDLSDDPLALQRLREAAERAKIELSTNIQTEVNLPFLAADASGPKHLVIELTRRKFEYLIDPIFSRLVSPVEEVIASANLDLKTIDAILLVGGSTQIPKVQELVGKLFRKAPIKDVSVDEIVAIGAAVQVGMLAEEEPQIVLTDVMPLSLGIETLGGVFTKLIERNTPLPAHKSEIFSTAVDNQTSVEVHVLQGERPLAADNRTLGKFHLLGIPPAPRAMPQIEVTFNIDVHGILNVSARDLATGRDQSLIITSSASLSHGEIDRMLRDADSRAADDAPKLEALNVRNQLDALIYQTQKTLNENRYTLEAIESEMKSAIAAGLKAIKSNNTQLINEAFASLQTLSVKMVNRMFQEQDLMNAESAATAQGSHSAEEAGANPELDAEVDAES